MSKYREFTAIPKDELITVCKTYTSLSAVLRHYGIQSDGRVRTYLRKFVNDHQLLNFSEPNANRYSYSVDDVRTAISTSGCWSDVVKVLGLAPVGGNVDTVKNIAAKHNFDSSHFNAELARRRNKRQWTVDEVLVEHSAYPRPTLGNFVKKNKLLIYRCIKCANEGSWNGTELRLELDHINGISDDNRIENLRWLCPNCHSQTETFGGSNKH